MLPLKDATKEKHNIAERMPFNVRMFKGLLNGDEYLLYLNQQLQIFHAIERFGLPDNNLARTNKVQADINELNYQGYHSNEILGSTRTYVDYLDSLKNNQVLPHIYLNYMALLFGGQMMKKAVPSTGRMYEFDDVQESISSIRNIQKDKWADEVNKGFDYIILIFEELEKVCIKV